MRPLGLAALLLVMGAPPAGALPQEKPALRYEKDIQPLLTRYCTGCHGGAKPKADLNLEAFRDEASVLKSRRTWKKVHDQLHSDEMPPKEKPQPTPAERERITDWTQEILARPSIGGSRDPGPVVIRRLNRTEYNNTVFDLFRVFKRPRGMNVYYDPAKGGMPESLRLRPDSYHPTVMVTLPTDDIAYGYNTIGEALSLPPFLLERYLRAAAEVVSKCRDPIQGLFDKAGRGSDRDKARTLLSSLGTRAYRRPIAADEVDRLLTLFDQAVQDGETPLNAVKVPLQAILVSPDFLYKVEKDGPADDPKAVRPLNDYELATRLSYFLWSSMPDDELFRLAADGKLRDPAVLEAQARRLLKSAKSIELADVFAMQWLQLEALEAIMPDPVLFPAFYVGDTSKAMRIDVLGIRMIPPKGWSNSRIRKMDPATDSEATINATTTVLFEGANRPKLMKMTVSQTPTTISSGVEIELPACENISQRIWPMSETIWTAWALIARCSSSVGDSFWMA